MRSLRASLLATVTVVASLAVHAAPAMGTGGNPVCTDPVPRDLCGGRIFAEPMQSATALTYAGVLDGLAALQAEHPDWITITQIGSSADDLDLLAVEVTAPADAPGAVPIEDRKVVLVNQSIHGNEPGGREGGVRYVEDLVTDRAPEQAELLGQVRLVQTFINPDGWTAGDHDHVQDDGGLGLWIRQNGDDGAVGGAGDVGFGIDLNRQAPWPGPSRREPAPVAAPEAAAYVEFVRSLAATSDIQAAVDIHGEVPDAAALIMLSAGEYDLDEALSARTQGDAMVDRLFAGLSESQANMLAQALDDDVPEGKLIASSEFLGGGTDTGYFGDWVSMASGGDAASLSTIELYSFSGAMGVHPPVGMPGVNSLTARKEVMQLYRDAVREILASMIEQAALEHDTTLTATGRVAWVDAHERVTDPVDGETVTSAEFYEDLAPSVDDGLTRLRPEAVTARSLSGFDAVVVSRDTLPAAGVDALRVFAADGGRVVLTDTGVALADALFGEVDLAPAPRIDGPAIVDIESGPLLEGVRDDAFMLIEPITIGYNRSLAGREPNVPTWTVDPAAWEGLGGSAEILADGAVAGGTVALGSGEVSIIGLLTPPVLVDGPDPIDHGIEAYGVLDTGYHVLANALGGDLVTVSEPAVGGARPVGRVAAADVERAPAPDGPSRTTAAGLVLLLGLAASVTAARRDARRNQTA